jgi:hypothetical protein
MTWEPINVYEPYEMIIWGIAALVFALAAVLIIISLIFKHDLTSDGKTMHHGHKKELISYFLTGIIMFAVASPVIYWQTNNFVTREHQNYASLIEMVKEEASFTIDENEAHHLLDKKEIRKNNKTVKLIEKTDHSFSLKIN